jgi:hypothetical protein
VDEQGAPDCPRCGTRDAVRQMGEAFARQLELVRERANAAVRPPASPSPPPPAGADASGPTDELYMEIGVGMTALFAVLETALEAAVVRPAAGWWATKGKARASARREEMVRSMQEALNRFPDLYYCGRDDVVFLRGGKRTVRSGEAGRLLMRHQDGRLMSLLGP